MRLRLLLVVVGIVVGPALSAAAGDVAIADLVADSATYDSSLVGEITIEGELIGDFQHRSEWTWVQVNGDAYAERALLDGGEHAGSNVGVGARIARTDFDALGVETPGGYRVRGAIVALTGEWHHHDPGRGGESWFEATSVALVAPEHHLDEPMNWPVFLTGLGLVLVAGLLALVNRRSEAR